MDLEQRLTQVASAAGILASALPDAISRGQQRFALPPTDAELSDWAASLKTSAPHFFPQGTGQPSPEEVQRQQVLDHLSPSEKLTRARAGQPIVRRKKPAPVTLTPEQVAELSSLPAMQRLAKYRELQDASHRTE